MHKKRIERQTAGYAYVPCLPDHRYDRLRDCGLKTSGDVRPCFG